MEGFSEDRSYLIAAADELEYYLLSGAAEWRIAGPESFPPLTPGNVLLTMKKLVGLSTADGECEQIVKALDQITRVRLQWNAAWKNRVKQEIPQRMRLWENYLEELLRTRNLAHAEYRWNIRWRVILALLAEELDGMDQETSQQLGFLDDGLRAISIPDQFIWAKSLEHVFDRGKFWFLYRRISRLS